MTVVIYLLAAAGVFTLGKQVYSIYSSYRQCYQAPVAPKVIAALSSEAKTSVCSKEILPPNDLKALTLLEDKLNERGLSSLVYFHNEALFNVGGISFSSTFIHPSKKYVVHLNIFRVERDKAAESEMNIIAESHLAGDSYLMTARMNGNFRACPKNYFIRLLAEDTSLERILEAHEKRISHRELLEFKADLIESKEQVLSAQLKQRDAFEKAMENAS